MNKQERLEERRKYNTEYRKKQRDKVLRGERARDHESRLRGYGLTVEEYDKKYEEQEGRCAICKKHQTEVDPRYGTPKRLCVDHDHATQKFRGLLCSNCNKGLGLLEDDVKILASAVQYLLRHR